MINIQKSYLVHIGSIWSILSYSVHMVLICLIQSILSTKVTITFEWSLWCAFVLESLFPLPCVCECVCLTQKKSSIRSIRSYSVYFGPFNTHWPYSVHIGLILSTLVLFGPHLFYLVHFGSIMSTSVLFSSNWSYLIQSVHFGPIQSLSLHYVHLGLIHSICSYSVLLGPPFFYLVIFCPFGPLCSIQSI